MLKSRDELASDLFTMHASIPLWRKSLSEEELISVYHEQAHRVLSWTSEEDRPWVTAQLNALVPARELVRTE